MSVKISLEGSPLDMSVMKKTVDYISFQSSIKDDAISNGDMYLLLNNLQEFMNRASLLENAIDDLTSQLSEANNQLKELKDQPMKGGM